LQLSIIAKPKNQPFIYSLQISMATYERGVVRDDIAHVDIATKMLTSVGTSG